MSNIPIIITESDETNIEEREDYSLVRKSFKLENLDNKVHAALERDVDEEIKVRPLDA